MREPEDKTQAFAENLISAVPLENRCPHLRTNDEGPYCGKGMIGNGVSEERRAVCDNYSLQLWCLDRGRCVKCLWYQGEKFREG